MIGLDEMAAMLTLLNIESQHAEPVESEHVELQPSELQPISECRPVKRSAQISGEGAGQKGARMSMPEHADDAVRSGRWRPAAPYPPLGVR